jgi:hypothetical protein
MKPLSFFEKLVILSTLLLTGLVLVLSGIARWSKSMLVSFLKIAFYIITFPIRALAYLIFESSTMVSVLFAVFVGICIVVLFSSGFHVLTNDTPEVPDYGKQITIGEVRWYGVEDYNTGEWYNIGVWNHDYSSKEKNGIKKLHSGDVVFIRTNLLFNYCIYEIYDSDHTLIYKEQ